jgi:hypothetical protein
MTRRPSVAQSGLTATMAVAERTRHSGPESDAFRGSSDGFAIDGFATVSDAWTRR